MKVLFIGDIIGKLGRKVTKQILPEIKKEFSPDFVLANGENLAHGAGITLKTYDEITMSGVDALTSGNHVWGSRDFIKDIGSCCSFFVRPANYPPGVPGKDHIIIKRKELKLGVICINGRTFMRTSLDCPFRVIDPIIEKIKKETKIILVDFHAEATSEKNAMGFFLDGKVSVMLGTHTHVQTADERVLPNGTAYISDVGMVGAQNSVIGAQVDPIIDRFLTGMPTRFEPEENGPAVFNAVLVEIDEKSGKTTKIERIYRVIEP